jgi:hypothetical protein
MLWSVKKDGKRVLRMLRRANVNRPILEAAEDGSISYAPAAIAACSAIAILGVFGFQPQDIAALFEDDSLSPDNQSTRLAMPRTGAMPDPIFANAAAINVPTIEPAAAPALIEDVAHKPGRNTYSPEIEKVLAAQKELTRALWSEPAWVPPGQELKGSMPSAEPITSYPTFSPVKPSTSVSLPDDGATLSTAQNESPDPAVGATALSELADVASTSDPVAITLSSSSEPETPLPVGTVAPEVLSAEPAPSPRFIESPGEQFQAAQPVNEDVAQAPAVQECIEDSNACLLPENDEAPLGVSRLALAELAQQASSVAPAIHTSRATASRDVFLEIRPDRLPKPLF